MKERQEICTHHNRQAKEGSLKRSCLEGIGDLMTEIRGDKKAGAQVMRAALAEGVGGVRLKIVLDVIKDTACSDDVEVIFQKTKLFLYAV